MRLWGFACGVGAFALVFATLDAPGVTWDESIYLGFANQYLLWFQHWGDGAFQRAALEHAWGKGQVHPPWGKLGIAAGVKLFHPRWPWAERLNLRAIRLASAIYFGLMTAAAFWWIAGEFGPRAGALAAAGIVTAPRLFGHAHFAALDTPMTALWFVTAALFAQIEKRRAWMWPAAAALGLAGLTKINAGFIPIALAPYAFWRMGRKALLPLAVMAAVSCVMFFALWPHMWTAPWDHLVGYVRDKASRMHIEAYYLGRAYTRSSPPWHYPLVMTLAATPLPTLFGAAVAVGAAARRRHPHLVLLAANAGVVLFVACLPFVPKYDGVRLFLPAFPFLACLGGVGLDMTVRALQHRWPTRPKLVAVAVVVAALLPAAESAHLHPFQLSYYNAAVGFLRGADALGFEPTYWGDSLNRETLDFLNRECPPRAKVAFFPVGSKVPVQLQELFMDLRSDLRIVDYESDDWDYLALVSRYGKFDARAWRLLRSERPVFAVKRWGVQLCGVYRRSERASRR